MEAKYEPRDLYTKQRGAPAPRRNERVWVVWNNETNEVQHWCPSEGTANWQSKWLNGESV